MIKRISLLLVMVLLLCTAAPALAESPAVHVTSVSLNTETMAFLPDSPARQLTAVVEPANATDARVYWMSSNESVATVDENGLVTPRGLGTTEITAETSNQENAVCTVTVTNYPVTSITLNHSELTMPDRSAYVLEALVGPNTAENQDITWASSDKNIAVVNQHGKIFAKAPGECWISAMANGGIDVIARCRLTVEPSDEPMKYLALTFDDGPCANTLDILDILEEYDVRVTFFCLGKLVDTYPDYVRKAAARGHEIANHSYNHTTLTKVSLSEAKAEIDKTNAAIEKAIGYPAKLARAPGGSINAKVATHIGVPFIHWTVDTNDWKYRDPEHVWTFIARNAGNMDIVLMHDIRPTTMEAMHKAIPYLLEQGYTLITVSELLELAGGVSPETMMYKP